MNKSRKKEQAAEAYPANSGISNHSRKIRAPKNGCQAALIRPAGVHDSAAIAAMHQRLSKESVYLRFLQPYRPSQAEIKRLIEPEMAGSAAGRRVLVAVAAYEPQKVVGLAYYAPDENDPMFAEPAVVVEDGWQGCGIGRALLERLARLGAANGVRQFRAWVLPTNKRILHLARQNPRMKRMHYDDGLMMIETVLY